MKYYTAKKVNEFTMLMFKLHNIPIPGDHQYLAFSEIRRGLYSYRDSIKLLKKAWKPLR